MCLNISNENYIQTLKRLKKKNHIIIIIFSKSKYILPGMSSVFCSLCFKPNEYAEDDWRTFFSDFSTSYEPGAEMKGK